MGSKTNARRVAIAAGAPVVPGTEQGIAGYEKPAAPLPKSAIPCC